MNDMSVYICVCVLWYNHPWQIFNLLYDLVSNVINIVIQSYTKTSYNLLKIFPKFPRKPKIKKQQQQFSQILCRCNDFTFNSCTNIIWFSFQLVSEYSRIKFHRNGVNFLENLVFVQSNECVFSHHFCCCFQKYAYDLLYEFVIDLSTN